MISDEPQIITLSVDTTLLPEWFDAIRQVAGMYATRMAVIEKPDIWLVRIEVLTSKIPAFSEALTGKWTEFVAARKAAGTWVEDDAGPTE